ncbi:MAG: lytic transglycosylase domain-containing protein [Deltaproteobacteria bacterium]|nr:lytic transglycosylase domain-containing protein [Deltaproteobacteria bacterium]
MEGGQGKGFFDGSGEDKKMMIRGLYGAFLSFVIILSFYSPAIADFYKYVDEEGVVHITNVPTSSKYRWIMEERRMIPGPESFKNISKKKYDDIIYNMAAKYGIDPTLVKAIVKAESDFDAKAVSTKGARGLMQLMPETSRRMGVRDIHDPEDNVEGGIRYLSKLLKMFNWQVPLAVAAYNAGENAVLKYGAIPPYSETQTYVKRVLYYYDTYKGAR